MVMVMVMVVVARCVYQQHQKHECYTVHGVFKAVIISRIAFVVIEYKMCNTLHFTRRCTGDYSEEYYCTLCAVNLKEVTQGNIRTKRERGRVILTILYDYLFCERTVLSRLSNRGGQ